MKGILANIFLTIAAIALSLSDFSAFAVEKPQTPASGVERLASGLESAGSRGRVYADTIIRTDTVVETRVVRRTEVTYRYDEVIYGNTYLIPDSLYRYVPEKKVVIVTEDPEEMIDSKQIATETKDTPEVIAPDRPVAEPVAPDMILPAVARKGERETSVNLDERVIFRGDTVNMVTRDRNLGRYDRGLFNYLFVPKGMWSFGATASYGEFSTSDLEVFDLMSDIDLSGHLFSIRPYFSYFIDNNHSVGMRFGYTSGKARIDSFNVDIDEDMNFNLHDIEYRSESYTAAITYRQYFGIARRGRFGIFNEVELAFSSGNSDFTRPYNSVLKTTHTNTITAALNFSPGVSVFIMDPVAFNVSFGVFGVSLKNEKQIVDGVDMGSRFTSGANFRFNIFNIAFGISVFL